MLITRNIKLILEYDGTDYGGWQKQKNTRAIEEVIEEAVRKITGEATGIIGCSRTDAGVHAKGFVCNFHTSSNIPEEKYRDALNSRLSRDIVVLRSREVNENFHSRYSCVGKTYSYTILNRWEPSALLRNYVYHYKAKLDISAMSEAAEYLEGTHDFAAFRNLGSSVKTTVRTISQMRVETEGDIIRIWATADGFLYNMVRIITGTLILVGVGKIKPSEVKSILLSLNRNLAGPSVPPQGLCLERVYY